MKILVNSESEMAEFGQKLGAALVGGECIELIGDVGAGKTTLTKSIARALGVDGPIQSPTFTICNRYETRNGLILAHYWRQYHNTRYFKGRYRPYDSGIA
jgi:tRNA threonylcarbamoyladenosine biosynthesis protein TsaE